MPRATKQLGLLTCLAIYLFVNTAAPLFHQHRHDPVDANAARGSQSAERTIVASCGHHDHDAVETSPRENSPAVPVAPLHDDDCYVCQHQMTKTVTPFAVILVGQEEIVPETVLLVESSPVATYCSSIWTRGPPQSV